MLDAAFYLVVVVFIAVLVIAALFAVRGYLSGASPMEAMSRYFAPKPEPRLDVIEQSNLDGRRRLVLIRRDDVEHLIMTGGPVDVVIETGINPPRQVFQEPAEPQAPAFSRFSRTKGQAGEA